MAVSIEIFKPGTHRDMAGRELMFSDADVQATAAAYDPALSEAPACVGHPKHDLPAYGWATGLRFADGGLWADLDQVDPQFAEMVKAGRFKKISASFYLPDSPANPKPGSYYLRHIGFLGAQPPAVKGLKPVAFAEGEAGVADFADYDQLDLVSILRGLREWIIETAGADTADRVMPSWTLDRLQNSAAQPEPDADDASSCCSETNPLPPELAEAKRKLDAERVTLTAERASFAEQRAAQRRADDALLIGQLIKSGRLLPAQRAGAASFLEVVGNAGVVSFGEGVARVEQSPRDWFLDFVAYQPRQVVFGEVAVPQDLQRPEAQGYQPPTGYHADPDRVELHCQALAYQETHDGVSYIAAVKAVGKER